MNESTATLIQQGGASKGDVLGVARLAGIMAAKRTANLIPLCHPVALTHVSIDFMPMDDGEATGYVCEAVAETVYSTGVEMEALTAVNIALLTVYDMVKAVDRGMVMKNIRLIKKEGGKSGAYTQPV